MVGTHPSHHGSPLALAVDIGGTKVAAALVDDHGFLVPGSTARAATGGVGNAAGLTRNIVGVVADVLRTAPRGARIVGVGIGSAGPVDLARGTVSPKNLPALDRFPVVDVITAAVRAERHTEALDMPVILRLDGTCIALAERWRGANRGARHSMAIVVSTGVGGGIILDGAMVSGASGNAGHIGQLRLRPADAGGPSDSGTLEGIAAGPRTVAWAQSRGWLGQTGEQLAASYADGDPVARAAVRRSAEAVGLAISNVTTLLDLEAVAIGGGFANVAPDYVDLVRAAAEESALFPYASAVTIRPTGLAGDGPLIGAAALVHRASDLALRGTVEPEPAQCELADGVGQERDDVGVHAGVESLAVEA
ncbi:ROK family protein [Okibacterium fritillariae]|uniref:ROK family protein n=1 Tax=Okibacterium fritillariae TaxID=123320 RepID=UPI0040553F7A